MNLIKCNVSTKEFNVKKICKFCDMPKNANMYWSAYTNEGIYDIYRTDSGVLYSKPLRTV